MGVLATSNSTAYCIQYMYMFVQFDISQSDKYLVRLNNDWNSSDQTHPSNSYKTINQLIREITDRFINTKR